MRYSEIKDLKVSAFTLGTAQLGYDYGINNAIGKPSREAAFYRELVEAYETGGPESALAYLSKYRMERLATERLDAVIAP